jgi:hypothetical protein
VITLLLHFTPTLNPSIFVTKLYSTHLLIDFLYHINFFNLYFEKFILILFMNLVVLVDDILEDFGMLRVFHATDKCFSECVIERG